MNAKNWLCVILHLYTATILLVAVFVSRISSFFLELSLTSSLMRKDGEQGIAWLHNILKDMLTRLESAQENQGRKKIFNKKGKEANMKWRQSLDRLDQLDNHSNCRLKSERKRDFTGGGSNHGGPQPAFYAKYMTL